MTMQELESRIKKLEDGLSAAQKKLNNVTGSPVIAAHYGARLDLNDDFNTLEFNTRLTAQERAAARNYKP